MRVGKDEIIAHFLFEGKIISFSVNALNETSLLAEGDFDFRDPVHLLKVILLSCPGTIFFPQRTLCADSSYNGLLRFYRFIKAVKGS